MNTDNDPQLAALFAQSRQLLPAEEFSAAVWQRISQQRRQQLVFRLALALLLVVLEWLLGAPLQQLLELMTQALSQSLFTIDSRWLELALTPINSAATVIAAGLLTARYIYRKVVK
tara:strand:- start:92 stop:439 length:348 start_codon:yes stop_codon:yes gene_type:complete